ncbi:probable vacuolar protein sorting-associated protein 72 homolog at N-terminal half [Coccomyxa sp. Obi]|nr:probable vacuolar protein sorting-associated protein 72 homolog at N-terminal half [Coccomyxa sp. Obi]
MSSEEDTDASSAAESSEEEEVEVPQIQLPNRATRGRRLEKLLEDEDSADEEFWNQDFFQEAKADEEYKTESSEASEADSDFEEAEESSDEEGEEVDERTKRKTLKPPGAAKKPTQQTRRPAQPAARAQTPPPFPDGDLGQPGSPMSPTTRAAVRAAQAETLAEAAQFKAPTLRRSTLVRVEEAQKERERTEQRKPRKAQVKVEYRPLTQEELLAEAAQTELENTASVAALMAAEEEIKARAAARKAKYCGPLLRYHSLKVDGESVMLYEIANMLPPKEMQPMRAPPPPAKPLCVITGRPAKYRDPETGMPYADAEAFKELRRRASDGRPLHSKRTKRRRVGTGGWAHVASTLREDFPSGPTMQATAAPNYTQPPAQKDSFGAAALQPPTATVTASPSHTAHALPGVPAAVAASEPAQPPLPSSYPAQQFAQRQAAGQSASMPSLQAVRPPGGASMAPPAAHVQALSGGSILPEWTAAPSASGGSLHLDPVQVIGTGHGSSVAGAGQPGEVVEGMHSSAANNFEGSGLGLVLDEQPGTSTAVPAAGVMQHVVPELHRTPL